MGGFRGQARTHLRATDPVLELRTLLFSVVRGWPHWASAYCSLRKRARAFRRAIWSATRLASKLIATPANATGVSWERIGLPLSECGQPVESSPPAALRLLVDRLVEAFDPAESLEALEDGIQRA